VQSKVYRAKELLDEYVNEKKMQEEHGENNIPKKD
jgi:hypothetical protein